MKSESPRAIVVEDLLRLKRAERPPAEFWSQFDRQLRAKQLAALVGKRPWWRSIPTFRPALSRLRLVLGTCAAVAITFFSVREYPAPGADSAQHSSIQPAVVVSSTPPAQQGTAGENTRPAAASQVVPAAMVAHDEVRPPSTSADSAIAPGELSRLIPWAGLSGIAQDLGSELPFAGAIAADLAVSQFPASLTTGQLLGTAHRFDLRAPVARPAIEPLQQMTPPSDTRRARLLVAMVPANTSETSLRTTERAANRYAEERLGDQNQRFDARGDRVQMKF